MKSVRKMVSCLLVVLLLTGLVLICNPEVLMAESKTKPIVLKATTLIPQVDISVAGAFHWYKLVNERAKGELTIKYLGGPEVIPPFDQIGAVQRGTVDIIYGPTGYFAAKVPAISSTYLCYLSPMECRKVGYYDLVLEGSEKAGIMYLGRGGTHYHNIYINIMIDRPQDLARKRIRAYPGPNTFIKALNCATITMPMGDIYNAMERNLIDGYITSVLVIKPLGLIEVTKYYVDIPVLPCSATKLVNLPKWNTIPKHLQDLMMQAWIETEIWEHDLFANESVKAIEMMQAGGMKPIRFSAEDTKWYRDLCDRSQWQYVKEKTSPELHSRLRELLQ